VTFIKGGGQMLNWLFGSKPQKDIFDMMVKAEVEIWLHKENLDRMVHGLEPLKWEGYNA
jgi:hypothetical protein